MSRPDMFFAWFCVLVATATGAVVFILTIKAFG
jgi:hypothetical protein